MSGNMAKRFLHHIGTSVLLDKIIEHCTDLPPPCGPPTVSASLSLPPHFPSFLFSSPVSTSFLFNSINLGSRYLALVSRLEIPVFLHHNLRLPYP